MPTYAFKCERCKKSFEVVLTVAERAAAKAACPTCGGGQVTPQMAIFTAKTSRKTPLGASRVPNQLRNPPQFVVHRCNRTGLLQGSAAAALMYMTRTRHARRRS